MNWSSYSRFVGDIFGAPLAIEGLLAFFLESTFLGLWIFGWDRLPKRVHLATHLDRRDRARSSRRTSSWPPTPGCSTRSATWCNPVTGRAELTDFMARADQHRRRWSRSRTRSLAAFMTTGAFIAGIAMYRHAQGPGPTRRRPRPSGPPRRPARSCSWSSGLLVAITGDIQGKIMTEQQPMKMAAAEALYQTEQPAPRSRSSRSARPTGREEVFSIRVPYLLSFLATGTFDGKVEGIRRPPGRAREARFGPGDYTPNMPGHLLVLPLDDRHGRAGRPARLPGSCSGCGRARTPAGRTVVVGGAAAVPAAGRQLVRRGCSPRSAASRGSCSASCGRRRRLAQREHARGPPDSWSASPSLYGALAVVDDRARSSGACGRGCHRRRRIDGSSTRPSRRSRLGY